MSSPFDNPVIIKDRSYTLIFTNRDVTYRDNSKEVTFERGSILSVKPSGFRNLIIEGKTQKVLFKVKDANGLEIVRNINLFRHMDSADSTKPVTSNQSTQYASSQSDLDYLVARDPMAANAVLRAQLNQMQSQAQSKDASVIGRGVAGAVIAGPAGAVVGALSAVDKNAKNRNGKK